MTIGQDMTTIIAVVVVGTHADRGREVIVDLTGDVNLSAIDILLTLHLRVDGVGTRHNVHLTKHTRYKHIKHRHTVIILHESATAHDTDHRREYPLLFLIRGEDGWHDRSRGLTLIQLIASSSHCLDIAILPGLLEVQGELPTLVSPRQTSRV